MAPTLPTTAAGIGLICLVTIPLAYAFFHVIYQTFLHPLRRFPGPMLAALSPLPIITHTLKGEATAWITSLHNRYGDVVRISPNELSFASADAYKDIYGHKKAGLPTLEKARSFYRSDHGAVDIVNADAQDHTRMRRIFSHAFSDRALKLQESLFVSYVDRLISKLRDGVERTPEQKINMVRMFNLTTFDIMGDLTFDEPLDMLNSNEYTPWVAAMFAGFKFGAYLQCMRYFAELESLLMKFCMPSSVTAPRRLHTMLSNQRVDRRIEKANARPDIWGLVLERDEATGLSREEMYSNARVFMIAGTETTATLLSGLLYYLLTRPETLKKLTTEIRTTFKTEDEITMGRMAALSYLNACLEEGLRMYPPVAFGLPRMTPPGSPTMIDGYQVPENTKVFVTNYAANRNANNWRYPDKFVPERWFPNSPEGAPYIDDKRHGLQPFSLGPRACLGKNMAYHEMRLILTKVVYSFDLSLCNESRNWNQQKSYIMWDKGELLCRVTPVVT